ncbi:MAG: hypothetical protein FWG14_05070 [Peptococcaceae bacterium]|nr:hypothetical protein [Peptococcaceae bacterium]
MMLAEQLFSQLEDTSLGTQRATVQRATVQQAKDTDPSCRTIPASAEKYKTAQLRKTPPAGYQAAQPRKPAPTAKYQPAHLRTPAPTAAYPPTQPRTPAPTAAYPPYKEMKNPNTQNSSISSEHKPIIHPIHQHHPSYPEPHIEKKQLNPIQIPKIKYVLIGLLLSLLTAGFATFKLISKYEISGNYDISRYESILSETEKQEWQTKQAKPQEVFLQLNTKIDVTNRSMANVRLINPPYSHYRYQIKLVLTGQNDVLYQATIDPGTVIEFAELTQSLAPGDHSALVSYEFLDSRGKVVGTSQVDVTLDVGIWC